MSAIRLHVIKPSVNNMSVRVFVRAAKLDFVEDDAYGKTRGEAFAAKNPSFLTPMVEADGLPKGVLWESCAIMQYLCNKHGLTSFYPTDPAARAMVDSAMFYIIGTLYPYVARATYPALGFPQYPGEVGASDAGEEAKAAAQKAAAEAIAQPLNVLHSFYLSGHPFIGGAHPSIADIRLAATLEFLAAIDYELPHWAGEFKTRMQSALGAAYDEPAADGHVFRLALEHDGRRLEGLAAPPELDRARIAGARRIAMRGSDQQRVGIDPVGALFRLRRDKAAIDEAPGGEIVFAQHLGVAAAPAQRQERPVALARPHGRAGPDPILALGQSQRVEIEQDFPLRLAVAIGGPGRATPEAALVVGVNPEIIDLAAAPRDMGDLVLAVPHRRQRRLVGLEGGAAETRQGPRGLPFDPA